MLGTGKVQGQPQHLLLILTDQRIKCCPRSCLGLANQGRFRRAGLRTLSGAIRSVHCS
jgi:hypothetical protein